jgi:hypothetical protein
MINLITLVLIGALAMYLYEKYAAFKIIIPIVIIAIILIPIYAIYRIWYYGDWHIVERMAFYTFLSIISGVILIIVLSISGFIGSIAYALYFATKKLITNLINLIN